jgi:hypothetical protein
MSIVCNPILNSALSHSDVDNSSRSPSADVSCETFQKDKTPNAPSTKGSWMHLTAEEIRYVLNPLTFSKVYPDKQLEMAAVDALQSGTALYLEPYFKSRH